MARVFLILLALGFINIATAQKFEVYSEMSHERDKLYVGLCNGVIFEAKGRYNEDVNLFAKDRTFLFQSAYYSTEENKTKFHFICLSNKPSSDLEISAKVKYRSGAVQEIAKRHFKVLCPPTPRAQITNADSDTTISLSKLSEELNLMTFMPELAIDLHFLIDSVTVDIIRNNKTYFSKLLVNKKGVNLYSDVEVAKSIRSAIKGDSLVFRNMTFIGLPKVCGNKLKPLSLLVTD